VPSSEESLATAAGRRVDVELTTELVNYGGGPAILCVFHEITERKRLERMFREGALRFRTLLEGSLIGVIERDAERVVAANDVFLKIIGRRRDELDRGDLKWADITAAEYAHVNAQKVEELLATGECKPCETE